MTMAKDASTLQDLASGALPSLGGGNPLQPSWSRSLPELMAANRGLIGNNGPAPAQPTAAAQVLLGSDRTNLGLLSSSMEAAKAAVPSKTRRFGGSIEETSRRHRDEIIERIIRKEQENSNRALEKAIESQLEEDWAKEREMWMEGLIGKRNVVVSSNTSLTALPQNSNLPLIPKAATSNLLPGYTAASHKTLDAAFAIEHVRVVASLNSDDRQATVDRFLQLASSQEGKRAYTTAWKLLGLMLPRLPSPIDGALGALIHFCQQYQLFIRNRVSAARLSGQTLEANHNYGSSMAGTISAYVKLDFGSSADFWHTLYFCLRCGDMIAARDILNSGGAMQVDFPELPRLRTIVSNLAQQQGTASCIWEMGNALLSTDDAAAMGNLYHRIRNLEPDNKHKIGVLALLSRNELTSFDTIEDYLFGRLWLALQSESPLEQIEQIGTSIKKYGPEHFGGPDDNGGWGYALPLLASQQFVSAITYLAEAGGANGLLEAAHLGVAFAVNDISIKDLDSSSPSANIMVPLLVKYANTLESEPSLGVFAALEYVLCIPNKNEARREVAALLGRSHQYVDRFVGAMKEDGARLGGELDKKLPKDEISRILKICADSFSKNLEDRLQAEQAAKFYMLAADFASLASMLNRLIAPTDQDTENKRYWWQETQRFHGHFLSKRTLATATLERDNALNLVTTMETLLKLREFFMCVRNEQFREAFEMMRAMDLLPFTQDQVNEKESKFKDLAQALKSEYPAIMVGTMQCLHGMHRKVKSESRGVDHNTEFFLKDLQMKARYIYIFSGLTNMPSTTKEDIQRLRNNMI